jgi:hypothetical protein
MLYQRLCKQHNKWKELGGGLRWQHWEAIRVHTQKKQKWDKNRTPHTFFSPFIGDCPKTV